MGKAKIALFNIGGLVTDYQVTGLLDEKDLIRLIKNELDIYYGNKTIKKMEEDKNEISEFQTESGIFGFIS